MESSRLSSETKFNEEQKDLYTYPWYVRVESMEKSYRNLQYWSQQIGENKVGTVDTLVLRRRTD